MPLQLRDAALQATCRGHGPHSGLRVGAALRSARGAVYAGCNVESAAFTLGVCAERSAIAAAVLAEGPGFTLQALAVAARDGQGRAVPAAPCGGCRQLMLEFGPAARIGFLDAEGSWRECSAAELLPWHFSLPDGA